MGNRHYDDMAQLRLEVEALIDAGRYRLTVHAQVDHPELSPSDKVAVVRHGGGDKLDEDSRASQPKYVCWAHLPSHGLCRAAYAVEDSLTGDLVVVITAFPEDYPMTKNPPRVSKKSLEATKKRILEAPQEPLLPTGHTGPCPVCNDSDSMVTTNNLTHTVATPGGLRQITRLPGAECRICGAKELDPGALAIIEENKGSSIWADYETRVSKSGKVPAILVKEDLRRVLGVEAGDSVSWKIIDRDHAYVEIHRARQR